MASPCILNDESLDNLARLRHHVVDSPAHPQHENQWIRAALQPPDVWPVNPRDEFLPPRRDLPSYYDSQEEISRLRDTAEDTDTEELSSPAVNKIVPLDQVFYYNQGGQLGRYGNQHILYAKIITVLRTRPWGSVTLRTGRLGGRNIKYVCKSCSLYAELSALEGFLREVRLYKSSEALCQIQGVAVPRVFGLCIDSSAITLNMELPDETLWMTAHPGMPMSLKKKTFKVLQMLHKQGVLHGNLAWHHILISTRNVFFVDFSCSRVRSPLAEVDFPLAGEDDFDLERQKLWQMLEIEGASRSDVAQSATPPQRVIIPGQTKETVCRALTTFVGDFKVEEHTSDNNTSDDQTDSNRSPKRMKLMTKEAYQEFLRKTARAERERRDYRDLRRRIATLEASDRDSMADVFRQALSHKARARGSELYPPETFPELKDRDGPPILQSLPTPPPTPLGPTKGILRKTGVELCIDRQRLVEMDEEDKTLDDAALKKIWGDGLEGRPLMDLLEGRKRGEPSSIAPDCDMPPDNGASGAIRVSRDALASTVEATI